MYALNILGFVTFSIFTDDISAMLNKLKNSGFSIHNVKVEKDRFIIGNIHWYNLNELQELVKDSSAELEILNKRGIIFKLLEYKRRLGIIMGTILACALIFYFSNTVLVIEVYGNESMSDRQIISVLNDYGIAIGKFIPALDIRRCERQIITAFDKFSWIGIRSSGCRILVEVSERVEAPEMVATSVPCNIISAKDAQIVDIKNVHMGMLVPMLNDGVKKGDLLISGTVDGKLDHDYYVHAMGEIIGRYDEEITFFQPYIDSVQNYSDEINRKSLYLFGMRIPLYVNKPIQSDFEYNEELNYLHIFKLSIPVGIICSEYKPYAVDETEYNEEQAKLLLENKIANYEANFYDGEDLKIINKKLDYKNKQDGIEVSVIYTLEGNIGIEQEILAKY